MPLVADKVLTLLAMPLAASLLGALAAGIALWRGRRRAALVLVVAAFAWLWFWATPSAAQIVVPLLVERHPARPIKDLPNADAIVVLSSNVHPANQKRPYALIGSTGDRLWHGARLMKAGLAPVIVVSGGIGWPHAGNRSMASGMRDMLLAFGIPSEAILVEGRSRTTRENALYTAELARRHGIKRVLLVTSQDHMSRASATFEMVGLNVVPAGVASSRSVGRHWALRLVPSSGQLSLSSFLIRERLGLWVYRLRGWI